MKRKIIDIDEEKCIGCGLCIPDCPEGALQIIDGKARLVSDLFCDGLGACIGTCPEGAICVVEREAEPYDEKAVMAEKIVPQGEAVIRAHLEHLLSHGEMGFYRQAIEYLTANAIAIPDHEAEGAAGACPGSAAQSLSRADATDQEPAARMESELRQWPVQLKLLNPRASYFEGADLLISGDCVPFAYADFHRDFLQNRIAIVFCPKLDTDIAGYIAKLAEVFAQHTVRSVTVLHMEVPCCSGVRYGVDQALERSGKAVPVTEYTITLQGQARRRTPPG
ncbi:MAG: 4Fe-4S binding protein [Methanoculleus sp.]